MAIINSSSVADNGMIVKNKDGRSESVDSFSSTIDVHRADFAPSKEHPTPTSIDYADFDDNDEDYLSSAPSRRFGVVNDDGPTPRFDVLLPPNHSLTPEEQLLRQALSSILILNSDSRPEVRTLLDAYDGHLVDVGAHLLGGLRAAAPSRLAARVGDYNENLFYEMRDTDQDVASIVRAGGRSSEDAALGEDDSDLDPSLRRDVESFEDSLRQSLRCNTNLKYRGSFLQTERTMYQPAHVDYDYPILQSYGERLFLAFFPLTKEGAFLQLWQDHAVKRGGDCKTIEEGTVVYIPYGKMFIVPSDTIHGGGFKRGRDGNLRFHLYIDVEVDDDRAEGEKEFALLDHPMNKYTERHDRRRELCERFVDADGLDSLLGAFFDD